MIWALLLALTFAEPAVTGVVKDSTGGIVSGATVIMRTGAGTEQRTVTGPDGTFTFPNAPDGQATLIVRAGGFAEASQPVSGSQAVEIVLALPKLGEAVMVTPTRSAASLGSVPASVNVITKETISESPAVIADDVLRQIPTFSLFRRTSAISANPTAQGVSLRGIGPSGVSRTLVLVDNVPFNDPFGGWVYWTKMPLEDVDRIEVVNGSSSSLYGNYAMGGVINVASRRPQRRTLEIRPQFGTRSSPKVDLFGSDVWGKVGMSVNGSFFDTDGFPQVIENERGPIDTNAAVQFNNVNVKLDYAPSSNVHTFLRGGYFEESRDNAKIATADGNPVGTPNGSRESNSTITRSVNTGVRWLLPDQSDLQATLFYDSVTYHQNFLAVPNPVTRTTARVSLNQKVPTENFGGMVQWSRALRTQHAFTAGTDWRWVDGDSIEDSMDTVTGTTPVLHRVAGGTQKSLGAFAQDIFTPIDKLTITGSIRVDYWRNYDGHNLETTVSSGQPAAGNVPLYDERTDTVASPRLAALYRVTDKVNVWGDYAGGFRAPTLNELYRQFSIGSNPRRLTLGNAALGPEHLKGGEAGVSVVLPGNAIARATWFDNRMEDPVYSKLLSATAAVNTYQRVNIGHTKIAGIQTDVETRVYHDTVKLSAAYVYNSAKVTENPLDTTLEGKYLAQVPKNRGSVQIAYTNPKYLNAAFGVQVVGRQFDDDLNVVVVPGETEPGLPAYALLDFTASRRITRNFDVFFGVQNLLDKEYIVQTGPTTVGAPRLVTGGFSVRFSER